LTRTAIAVLAALIVALASAGAADNLAGQASVIDGDTLEVYGTRIRLWGIDAPESTQLCRGEDSLQYRCGAKAANDRDAFIARRPVSCIPISLDQYRRTVATCSVSDVDLGEWLVRNGLAIDWPQQARSQDTEDQLEQIAHQDASLRRPPAASTPNRICGTHRWTQNRAPRDFRYIASKQHESFLAPRRAMPARASRASNGDGVHDRPAMPSFALATLPLTR